MGDRIHIPEFDPYANLSGNTYGFIHVDSPYDESVDGKIIAYNCTCLKCGKTGLVYWAHELFNFQHLTCGCVSNTIHAGAIMGVWTVVEKVVNYQNRHPSEVWTCYKTLDPDKTLVDCSRDYLVKYSRPVKGRITGSYKHEDITGQMFGKLKAIRRALFDDHNSIWRCQCQCPAKTIVYRRIKDLKTGTNSKMSCWECERASNHIYEWSEMRIVKIRKSMGQKCYNPKNDKYSDYGGRGIRICEEWKQGRAFIDWSLAHGHKDGLSIDRIDVDGDYCPENCRWTTGDHQANNLRTSLRFTIEGHNWCAWDWSILCHQEARFLTEKCQLHGREWCIDFIMKNWDRSRTPTHICGRRYLDKFD